MSHTLSSGAVATNSYLRVRVRPQCSALASRPSLARRCISWKSLLSLALRPSRSASAYQHERRFSHSLSPTSMGSIRHLGFGDDRAVSDVTGNLIRPAAAIGSRASETYNKVYGAHPICCPGLLRLSGGARLAADFTAYRSLLLCVLPETGSRAFRPTPSQPPSRGNGSPGHWHCKADMATTYSEGDLPRIQP